MPDNFFSSEPQEEFVFDYRPSIIYNPRELNTVDNSQKQSTGSSIDYSVASALSKRYLNNNVVDLISIFNRRVQIIDSLLSDISQYLLDINFSININVVLPNLYNDIISNNQISFKEYQNIPRTEEYQLLHDIWFKEATKTRGNLVAEVFPLVMDIVDDLKRVEKFGNGLILYGTPFDLKSDPDDIRRYIISRAENYEHNFGKLIQAQEKQDIKLMTSIKKENRQLECELKLDSEINGLFKNGILMLEEPLKIGGAAIYKEIDGKYRDESLEEINKLRESSAFERKDILIPILYGHKNIENIIIKDRMIESNQYSGSLKEENLKKVLTSGKTWKNICIPDLAKYLTIGYNSSKILSHLVDGIKEVNTQLVDGLKDYYKISLGEMYYRKKISADIVYKNTARHIYNNITGGL